MFLDIPPPHNPIHFGLFHAMPCTEGLDKSAWGLFRPRPFSSQFLPTIRPPHFEALFAGIIPPFPGKQIHRIFGLLAEQISIYLSQVRL
jgi:hypothetical protein